ncbi:MAG: endonuclease/exonuclease/phosphatase family protein, partial [Dolichospermum sp.]
MKIATWNVNSVRTRLEQVINWLTENPVDVLCLQETKVIDKDFPNLAFENLGYYPYIS